MDEIKTTNIELEHSVAKLLSENELLHKEIEHLKKIYKDQFDSIKKTRALSKEHCDSLIAQLNSKSMENADLKGQIQEKVFVTTALQNEVRSLKGKHVLDNATTITNATIIAPGMFKLDIEHISHRLKNNRDAYEDYLKKTIENTDTIRGLVERARKQNPSEPLLDSACKFTKHVQELLVYVSQTCPSFTKPSEKLVVVTPMNKVKKVRFSEPLTSSSNIHKQEAISRTPDSNTPVLPSTGLKSFTSVSRSQPTGNKKNDRISQTPHRNMKNKVEDHPRSVKSKSNKKNRVKDPICDGNVKHTMLNANSELICVKFKQCMFDANHDVCFLDFINDVNVRSKSKSAKQSQHHNIWKPTGKVFTEVGYKWKPTGKLFTLVEGLGHNLFSVGQFCDSDFEVAFRKNTCFIQNLDGVDLLSGSRDINLYTISLDDMLKTSPICLLSKASKTKSWLWHPRLSHLNFGTLNKLAKDGLARGIPKLKFKKDHMRLACALGKSKKSSHQPKAEDTNQEKLYLLHMDLYGPMRVQSINGKKYILMIVDDYSRFTWVKFLRSKDEAPDAIIKCIKNIQVRLNATVRNVRTDNGTEFVNQTLREFYENVSISHQTSVACTPQQNGVVERRNRTLVEAARTMLIFLKALLFSGADSINTACKYPKNHS
ncbi:retrovirus-related pol polyprotein from transposon TNT 1-94 [Tanacetum coccineum]